MAPSISPAEDALEIPVFRTSGMLFRRSKHPEFARACESVMRASRALENSTTFLLRNFLSSFEGLKLKATLHAHQAWAVDAMDQALGKFLNKRSAALHEETAAALEGEAGPEREAMVAKLQAKIESLPKRKGVDGKGSFGPSLASNLSVVDLAYRELRLAHSDGSLGYALQKALPAAIANGARDRTLERFSSYRAAIKKWREDPAAFSGQPQMPGYADAGSLASLRIQGASIGKNLNKRLPSLEGKALFEDGQFTVALSDHARQAWAALDMGALEERLRGKLDWSKTSDKPKKSDPSMRSKGRARACPIKAGRLLQWELVPHRDGIMIQAVFECWILAKRGTVLASLFEKSRPQVRAQNGKKTRKDGSATFTAFEVPQEALAEVVASWTGAQFSRAASMDLGVSNVATVAFGNGRKTAVVSGAAFERQVGAIDKKIDAAVPAAIGPRLRELRAAKDDDLRNGRETPQAIERELRQHEALAGKDPQVQRLRGERQKTIDALLHQLSRGLVNLLAEQGVEVLVVGKNLGWKNGVDLGKAQNRRFGRIPHAKLIEMMSQKCMEAGIAVLAREESWTSACSFAANEAFPPPPGKAARNAHEKSSPPKHFKRPKADSPPKNQDGQAGASTQPPRAKIPPLPQGDPRQALMGKRRKVSGSNPRSPLNLFETPVAGRWSAIHADANGAFNILRKACPNFKRNSKLSSDFELFWISGRGVRPWKKKPARATAA